jgi:flagellar biosynthesis/type III secretory pathway chaperone
MDDIKELKEVLESQCGTLKKLLAAEKDKTGALEKSDIDKLNAQINVQQALIMECSAAEKRREQVCGRMGVGTMSELFEKYPQSKEYIGELYSELLATVNEIRKVKFLNERLLETRLGVIKLMNAQLGINTENAQYGKAARKKANRGSAVCKEGGGIK